MFNKVIIMGRITHDVELKTTTSGLSVTNLSVAVDDGFGANKKKTNFFNVTVWRATAEFVARWFKKGDPILICGSLDTEQYTGKDGRATTKTVIIAEKVYFVPSSERSSNRAQTGNGGGYSQSAQAVYALAPEAAPDMPYEETPAFEDLSDDDALPF